MQNNLEGLAERFEAAFKMALKKAEKGIDCTDVKASHYIFSKELLEFSPPNMDGDKIRSKSLVYRFYHKDTPLLDEFLFEICTITSEALHTLPKIFVAGFVNHYGKNMLVVTPHIKTDCCSYMDGLLLSDDNDYTKIYSDTGLILSIKNETDYKLIDHFDLNNRKQSDRLTENLQEIFSYMMGCRVEL
jgi:hypothetical protein